jgi:RHS repeat-associated protein
VRTIDTSFTLSLYQWRGVWGERQTGTLQTGKGYCANLGHQEDETGLVYMRARYYEPTTGRFVSEDPAGHGMNWFLYADRNPITYLDFTGKFLLPDQAEAVAQGIGLTARQAAALRTFAAWYEKQLIKALANKNLNIIIQFVEDSMIPVGLESGSFTLWPSGGVLLIQLGSGGRNLRTLIHEMAEALLVARGRGGIVSEAEAALLQIFQHFLQGM